MDDSKKDRPLTSNHGFRRYINIEGPEIGITPITLSEAINYLHQKRMVILTRLEDSITVWIDLRLEAFTYLEKRSVMGSDLLFPTSPRPISELSEFIGQIMEDGYRMSLSDLFEIYQTRTSCWIRNSNYSLNRIRIEFELRARELLNFIEPKDNKDNKDNKTIGIRILEDLVRSYLEILRSDPIGNFNNSTQSESIIEYTRKLLNTE